jgi:hypothetical protein
MVLFALRDSFGRTFKRSVVICPSVQAGAIIIGEGKMQNDVGITPLNPRNDSCDAHGLAGPFLAIPFGQFCVLNFRPTLRNRYA